MYIEVKRCKDDVLAEKLLDAASFYGSALLSRQMRPYIEIEIKILKTLRDDGQCSCEEYNMRDRPRGFSIAIADRLSEEEKLLTLAHEMVHVKQFAVGELNDDQTRWQKSKIAEDIPYLDLPWEVEARCLEYVLYDMYQQHINRQS